MAIKSGGPWRFAEGQVENVVADGSRGNAVKAVRLITLKDTHRLILCSSRHSAGLAEAIAAAVRVARLPRAVSQVVDLIPIQGLRRGDAIA